MPGKFGRRKARFLAAKALLAEGKAESPAPPAPARPRNDTSLNFKLSADLVQEFKAKAAEDRLRLNELFARCFAAYLEKHAGK